jgi:hypothetical protein
VKGGLGKMNLGKSLMGKLFSCNSPTLLGGGIKKKYFIKRLVKNFVIGDEELRSMHHNQRIQHHYYNF